MHILVDKFSLARTHMEPAMQKHVFQHMRTVQKDQGLCCLLLRESLDTTECMNGEQRPVQYFVHGQDAHFVHV